MAEAPGWDAIDAALARIYGDVEPYHWGTVVTWALGGPDPLDGVSAFRRTDPVPHWHYVSYGLTQLYADGSETNEHSGWGFELTFRLARDPADDQPPAWAANFLQNLARYVFRSGNWFEPGHHMNAGGPIAAERPETAIRAMAFVEDPELGTIDTVHGRVQFLQVVGLTTDEYEAVQLWNTISFLEVAAESLPLWVTDVGRGSLLDDASLAARVQAGVEREGSSTGALMVDSARWEMEGGAAVVTLGALPASFVARLLRARLPFDQEFVVAGQGWTIRFRSAEAPAVAAEGTALDVGIPPSVLDALIEALRPHGGPVTVTSGLAVRVEPTVVRDAYGNPTGEVVG